MRQYLNEAFDRDSAIAEISSKLQTTPDDALMDVLRFVSQERIDKEQIIQYFKDREIDDVWKHVVRIIKDNNRDYNNFIQLIKGELPVPDSSILKCNGNIYQHFQNIFSFDTLQEICAFAPARNSATRGAGEILCRLILKDIDKGKADVHAGGLAFEFKGDDARVRSSVIKSPAEINDKFKNMYPDIDYKAVFGEKGGIFRNEKVIDDLFEIISDDNDIKKKLPELLLAQFDPSKSELREIEELVERNMNVLRNKSKERCNLISKFFGVIDLYYYHKQEKFDYFIVGKPSANKAKDIASYISIPGDDLEIMIDIFNIPILRFSGYPRSESASQDSAVHVHANI